MPKLRVLSAAVVAASITASAQELTLFITPDRTEAEIGDVINFVVTAELEGSVPPQSPDGYAYLPLFSADFLACGTGSAVRLANFQWVPPFLINPQTGASAPAVGDPQADGSFLGAKGFLAPFLLSASALELFKSSPEVYGSGLELVTFSVAATAAGTFGYTVVGNEPGTPPLLAIVQTDSCKVLSPFDEYSADNVTLVAPKVTIVEAGSGADIDGDGMLTFGDVTAFVEAFTAGRP